MRRALLLAVIGATLLNQALAVRSLRAATVPTYAKWSQPPDHEPVPGTNMSRGENIWSDVDWRGIMQPQSPLPNWVVADDFISNGDPIVKVRWWGSYPVPDFEPRPMTTPDGGVKWVPTIEDGFLLSFFSDMKAPVPAPDPFNPPRPPDPAAGFSKPDQLLGSYVAPVSAVTINPTPIIGWDNHRVWEYEVCLIDTHLDHPTDLARPDGFYEQAGDIYWLSIAAENGHELLKVPNPTDPNGEPIWQSRDTNDQPITFHYWGWHTSPKAFNDVATMGSLLMPGNEWLYQPWQPIHPQHGLWDMAFELHAPVPEPASGSLALAAVALVFVGRRVRRRD